MNSSTHAPEPTIRPLLLKVQDVCRLLGGIHPRSLARLEKRGLIQPIAGLLRHKLYAAKDVHDLVENLKNWEAKS
jgi:DNA-binding transcriptional MerR regulator